jgi:hypothetical protein
VAASGDDESLALRDGVHDCVEVLVEVAQFDGAHGMTMPPPGNGTGTLR